MLGNSPKITFSKLLHWSLGLHQHQSTFKKALFWFHWEELSKFTEILKYYLLKVEGRSSVIKTFRQLLVEEGAWGMTKGLSARIISSLPTSVLIVVGYETLKRLSLRADLIESRQWWNCRESWNNASRLQTHMNFSPGDVETVGSTLWSSTSTQKLSSVLRKPLSPFDLVLQPWALATLEDLLPLLSCF